MSTANPKSVNLKMELSHIDSIWLGLTTKNYIISHRYTELAKKVCPGFSTRWYRKTWTNFFDNPTSDMIRLKRQESPKGCVDASILLQVDKFKYRYIKAA